MNTAEQMAEQLHVWYLEATQALDPANYNPKAQKSYAELNDQQKEIDRYIAVKVLAAIEKALADEQTKHIVTEGLLIEANKELRASHASDPIWTIERIEEIMQNDPSTWKSALAFELNRAAHASERKEGDASCRTTSTANAGNAPSNERHTSNAASNVQSADAAHASENKVINDITAEAMRQIMDNLTHTLSSYDLDLIHEIIKAAIEKATAQIQRVLEAERDFNESTIQELEDRVAPDTPA